MNLNILEQKIDVAIADYLAEAQSQALQTIQRKLLGHSPKKSAERVKRRKLNQTRTKAEIAILTELLFQAILDLPGNSLQFLTTHLKQKPRRLETPASHLKQGGRIRVIGRKENAKYFPTTKTARQDATSSV
jgi:hypothetical protein